MAITLGFTHSQPGFPFTPAPNFIEQASVCEHIVNVLAGSHDPGQRQVFSNKLHTCLSQLQPGLLDPIPDSLIDNFIVDTLPEEIPRFEPDCTDLCRYCMALSVVLGGNRLDATMEMPCEICCAN